MEGSRLLSQPQQLPARPPRSTWRLQEICGKAVAAGPYRHNQSRATAMWDRRRQLSDAGFEPPATPNFSRALPKWED